MINKVILVGRLTKDPELRKTANNTSVLSFTVACNRRFGNNQNGNQQSADFINCVAWNQSADFLSRYANKGSLVGIEGRISTRNYEKDGRTVYVTEVTCENVQLLSSRNEARSENASVPATYVPNSNLNVEDNNADDEFANTPSLDISSDDLPFY